jgi:hypothetical protein
MMTQMKRSAAISPLAAEFEEFLFAPIGEEANGMLLSVFSALARLDIDPWQEAGKLARLPVAMATERLVSFIAAVSEKSPAHQEPEAIAARLIKLLPHSSRTSRLQETDGGPPASAHPQTAHGIIYAVIYIALALGFQLFQGSHQSQAQADTVHASPSHPPAASDVTSPRPR